MKIEALLALGIISFACLHRALAGDSSSVPESMLARCTQDGAAKGYQGKELEDFVATCVRAGQSGGEDDPVIRVARSAC